MINAIIKLDLRWLSGNIIAMAKLVVPPLKNILQFFET